MAAFAGTLAPSFSVVRPADFRGAAAGGAAFTVAGFAAAAAGGAVFGASGFAVTAAGGAAAFAGGAFTGGFDAAAGGELLAGFRGAAPFGSLGFGAVVRSDFPAAAVGFAFSGPPVAFGFGVERFFSDILLMLPARAGQVQSPNRIPPIARITSPEPDDAYCRTVGHAKSIFLLAAAAIGLFTAALDAQTGTAALSGHVLGPAGTPLRGASVSLDSEALIAPRTVTTGNDGVYRFAALPPGLYVLRMALAGYREAAATVRVHAAQRLRVDATLQLGDGSSAEGQADVPVFLTANGVIATPLTDAELRTTPIEPREGFGAIGLAPGIRCRRLQCLWRPGRRRKRLSDRGPRRERSRARRAVGPAGL